MPNVTPLRLPAAKTRWWGKPLVRSGTRDLPAELVILAIELRPGEDGVWLNSRGAATGVVDLLPDTTSRTGYRTRRKAIPAPVAEKLRDLYQRSAAARGCPDIVIWSDSGLRFVEVKRVRFDSPSVAQKQFMQLAAQLGIEARLVEWTFDDSTA